MNIQNIITGFDETNFNAVVERLKSPDMSNVVMKVMEQTETYAEVLAKSNLKDSMSYQRCQKILAVKKHIMVGIVLPGVKIELVNTSKEGEWSINPSLRGYVYNGMPNDLTLEEKAMYIYSKLVKTLKYSQSYAFRGKHGVEEDLSNKFNKKKLEGITPDSELLCFCIARVWGKFIDELGAGIKSVVVSEGEHGEHYAMGFYTDNVSVRLESAIAYNGFHDFFRAKSGMELEGVKVVSDKHGLIEKALNKVFPLVFERKLTEALTTEKYMEKLKAAVKVDAPHNFEKKFKAFIHEMKKDGISGSEATQALVQTVKAGFWGDNVAVAIVGELTKVDGISTRHLKTIISLDKDHAHAQAKTDNIFMFDPDKMSIRSMAQMHVRELLQVQQIIYKDESQKIIGIDKEITK